MKQLLLVVASLFALVACQEDQPIAPEKELFVQTLSLSFEAEVEGDDTMLRAFDYVMTEAQKPDGTTTIIPKLNIDPSTQTIIVHTAVANKAGTIYGAADLAWEYTPASGNNKARLRCHLLDVPLTSETAFTPTSSEEFYVTGIIGGNLLNIRNSNQRVDFSNPNTVLKSVSSAGDHIELEVPFAFKWTKLKIFTDPQTGKHIGSTFFNSGGQRDDALVVDFKPLGSLIGYQIGNGTDVDVTPEEFFVQSRLFGHSGSFNMRTPVTTGDGFPSWTFDQCAHEMWYTFAPNNSVGRLEANQKSSKRYYTWVMPNAQGTGGTRIVAFATSSTQANTPLNRYWATDYTRARSPQQHKAHLLRFNISKSAGIRIPVEDISQYNLAGGEQYMYKFDQSLSNINPWPARTGDLRLSQEQTIAESGMYNLYVVAGIYDAEYNPDNLNLSEANIIDTDGVTRPLKTNFYIPSMDDWAGVIPPSVKLSWTATAPTTAAGEKIRLGGGTDAPTMITTTSEYSKGYTLSTTQDNGNRAIYAIRFRDARVASVSTGGSCGRSMELRLTTAFRYRYLRTTYPAGKRYALAIDVVYLGNEATGMVADDLASLPETFWTNTNSVSDATKGAWVTSTILPATADMPAHRGEFRNAMRVANATSSRVGTDRTFGHYWSTTWGGYKVRTPGVKIQTDWWSGELKLGEGHPHFGQAVRLFKKQP